MNVLRTRLVINLRRKTPSHGDIRRGLRRGRAAVPGGNARYVRNQAVALNLLRLETGVPLAPSMMRPAAKSKGPLKCPEVRIDDVILTACSAIWKSSAVFSTTPASTPKSSHRVQGIAIYAQSVV